MESKTTEFDIIVWGATGFTGRLVVEYLLENYGVNKTLRWAIAGRNQAKLEALKAEFGPTARALSILTADSHEINSLIELVNRTNVIISTVGPYALHGSALVATCAKTGTHYCDLAGEPQWIRKMIDQHEDTARQSGARIVPSCGFDSIPSDLGVFYLQNVAQKQFGNHCRRVKMRVKAMRGGASGGTIASMMNAIEEARADKKVARILVDPYSLCPKDFPRGPDKRDQGGPIADKDLGGWTAPFIMAGINTKVVRRTNALLGKPWGEEFSYQEAMWTGSGITGYLKALQITMALGGVLLAGSISILRNAMRKLFLPAPGEGPNEKERHNGFYKFIIHGKTDSNQEIYVSVLGDRDPGYGSTSKILGEAGVCLALDELKVEGGFWTPASAMGEALLKRLPANAGLTFSSD